MTTDDVLLAKGASIAGPISLVAIIIQQLWQSILDTKRLKKFFKNGEICECCFKRKKRETWIKFGVVLALQTGGLVLTSLILNVPLQVLFGVLVSILTVSVVSKVNKISSPFVGQKDHVESFDKIKKGDIVSWKTSVFRGIRYYHDGIVTECPPQPNSQQKKAELKVIHYSAPGLFTKGTVLSFDLERDELRLHDYTGYDINEPDEVVERARKRLFGLTNRSAHFCHWAKLQDVGDREEDNNNMQQSHDGEITLLRPMKPDSKDCGLIPFTVNHHRTKSILGMNITRPYTSMKIEKVDAKIRDDIQPGQLIRFTYRSFPHNAVCTTIRPRSKASEIEVGVIHYGAEQVETLTFDLNKVAVTIIKVHPIYKYRTEDIIRRARAKIDEKGYNLLFHRSSHLAELSTRMLTND